MRFIFDIFFLFLGVSFFIFITLFGLHNLALIDLETSEFMIISPAIGLLIAVYELRNFSSEDN